VKKLTGFNLDAMGTGKGKVTGRMEVVKGVRNLSLDADDAALHRHLPGIHQRPKRQPLHSDLVSGRCA